jgi:hypothetical protein
MSDEVTIWYVDRESTTTRRKKNRLAASFDNTSHKLVEKETKDET